VQAESVSREMVGGPFQVIVSLGLFIYLNDDELEKTLMGYADVAESSCRILVREPIGTQGRLTIKEHFSDDMDQVYNAIYRTEDEILDAIEKSLIAKGFRLASSGDVYDASL